jgi:predicted RND superfamily exporter protein
MQPSDKRFNIPGSEWLLAALTLICVSAVLFWIDLSPRVESDFFFSPEDPQLQAAQEISRRFPAPELVVIRAEAPDINSDEYEELVRNLTAELDTVTGVSGVTSMATEDERRSPVWSRLLLTPEDLATNIIVSAYDPNPADLIPRLEAVWELYEAEDFALDVSGVPYVIELIRRNLFRDLVLFSSAAFLIFGTLVSVVYRDWRIVLGTICTCMTACAVTLFVAHLLDIKIGLLTANIAVIVFVLTLSHIVFMTSNWRRCCQEPDGQFADPVAAAVRITLQASFWCMLTTLLGFLSLLIATARPLRELGIAGAIGTLTAIVITYGVYPTFLRCIPSSGRQSARGFFGKIGSFLPETGGNRWLLAIGGVVLVAAAGLRQFNTDPSLLSYFAPGSDLREGLEIIDRDGGSSPLNIVVADSAGTTIDTDDFNRKMWALQNALESDSSVGSVISPAVLLAHVRMQPFMSYASWSTLLTILEGRAFAATTRSFIRPERDQGKFFIRMREAGRTEDRDSIIARISGYVEGAGLESDRIGGSYELQGQLGQLIASSLRIGLGGLLILFIGIGFIVSRTVPRTIAMFFCLCGIPLIVLGTMGHLGMPIDIITSPAANVAIAMGVDSMIHLVLRVRRLWPKSATAWDAWKNARAQMWQPVLGATLIICAGFGIFSLSAFPPTQRFGLAVILGTLTAATMTLVTLPFAVNIRRDRPGGFERAA